MKQLQITAEVRVAQAARQCCCSSPCALPLCTSPLEAMPWTSTESVGKALPEASGSMARLWHKHPPEAIPRCSCPGQWTRASIWDCARYPCPLCPGLPQGHQVLLRERQQWQLSTECHGLSSPQTQHLKSRMSLPAQVQPGSNPALLHKEQSEGPVHPYISGAAPASGWASAAEHGRHENTAQLWFSPLKITALIEIGKSVLVSMGHWISARYDFSKHAVSTGMLKKENSNYNDNNTCYLYKFLTGASQSAFQMSLVFHHLFM